MSVKVMGAVFDLEISPNQKLVLLAYADHAHHDGTSVYPAAASIAKKTSYSIRSVRRIARELEGLGYLVDDGRGPHGTRKWKIPFNEERGVILSSQKNEGISTAHVGGDKSDAVGVSNGARGVTPAAPEPSLEPSDSTVT